MDDLAADDCERSAPGERPARERRVAAFREELCGMHGPAGGDVQHDDVGGRLGFQRSAREPKCDGGCGAHAKDQLGERQHASRYELRMSPTEPRVDTWHRCTCPPVRPASSTSRPTTISSAAAGMPLRPSRAATSPSCITPPAASVGSSQWSATGISKVRAYSSAVRMRWLETTGLPSSETATAPAPTISPNSESRSPFWPTEMAPIGYTRVSPARTDWRTMKPTAA